MLERNTPMKRLTGLVLTLCVLLTSAGCNSDTAKTSDDSSSEATSQTTSVTEAEDTTKAQTTIQTVAEPESTTEEAAPDNTPTENEVQILRLDSRTTYEYRWSDETAAPLVECEYTAILLSGDDADRYPALAAVLADTAAAEESNLKTEYEMFSEAVDEITATGAELQEPFASRFDAQVRRADSVVLSILTDCNYNNGMNGGHSSFWGSNYDTQTGETLNLPDIVTDMDSFAKAVEEQLFSTVGADVFYNDGIIKEYFEMYGADGTHWTIDYNGITMYFNAGEISDLGFGGISTTITFAENAELFKEKYMAVPDAYIVSMPMKYMFNTDLDLDGRCENLIIYDRYDEENNYEAEVDIYMDSYSYMESCWAYGCEPYYVKTADNRSYLYLFTELETQMYLYVYDLMNGMIVKVGEADLSPYYNDGISAVLTDPDNMHFDIFSDEAGGGVSEGNDIFSVGPDGMPAQG